MKKLVSAISAILILCSATFITDGGPKLPAVDVKKLDGSKVSTSTFTNNGKPIVISFWATWCKPCKKELDAISENLSDWQKETGVKVIAISTDDARSIAKVPNDVKTKGWEFEVYTDENGDFQRAMNVVNVPHTFIINGKGEIVWSHNSYAEGDEDRLYENVKKVAGGQKLEH
jgi:cytochrome c biogenesis protein CcmG, thiol:disulfide interchange protein DsbE